MLSSMHCNVGVYLHYMAVNVGYSLDMTNVIGNVPINHKKTEFGFSCARFNIDAYYSENTGGTYIRKFGEYDKGHLFKDHFPGLKLKTYGVDIYYFLNNRKYSHGAAYNFSKYQIKSAGSFIFGFTYSNQDITIDFNQLPEKLVPYMTNPIDVYKYNYNSYCVLLGYGYNWVFARNFLFNISAIPSIGINHGFEDSVDGRKELFTTNIKARSAIVYNYGDFFTGLSARMDGHWYKSKEHSFFSALENVALAVGVRF
jgi:hypothetical protein